MTCAYFVSDIHLTSSDEPNARALLALLEKLRSDALGGSGEKPTHLFLVGDIFDLWIGSHEYFVQKFGPVIRAIRAVVDAGVTVHFFEGNHDLHLKKFWQDKLGVQVHSDAEIFELAGKTVRVEHGDLINPDDKGYLFLRSFLRTSAMRALALNLPSRVVAAIGERASRASRSYTSTAKELPVDKIRRLIRTHAERVFREKPFDLIITGHVHVVDDVTFPASGRDVRSINLGSWYDGPKAFVVSDSHVGRFTW